MRKIFYIFCVLAAGLAIGIGSTTPSYGGVKPVSLQRGADTSPWKLKWQTNFSESAALGSFSGCNGGTPTAVCTGLPADLQSQWWAYPYPWPDTATEEHMALGGYYDPSQTIWISGGQMHIRMFRTTQWIHSAAVVPKAAMGMLYGKYVERFSVSADPSPGYKSAHLLWPSGNALVDSEVDFPEGNWNSTICAYVHSPSESSVFYFCPGASWTTWHTSEILWAPNSLTFYLDGKKIGSVTGKWVPDEPMSWILQNESALYGAEAPENSSAQMNISSVAVYSYQG
jgi:Glycosyl hydrolases family 16